MTDNPQPQDQPTQEKQLSVWEKIQMMLHSRKFWVLCAAILTAIGAHVGGSIDTWQMLQAILAALAVYSTGIAIVDAGAEFSKR